MIKLLIFDLDDTLYPERSYVLSGYRAVSDFLASRSEFDSDLIFDRLAGRLGGHGRSGAFDWILNELEITHVTSIQLVRAYRRHLPSIEISPEVIKLLNDAGKNYKMALITNGWPGVQMRKVAALNLASHFDLIVYSQLHGLRFRKPHPRFFRKILRHFSVNAEEAMMIGDDEEADGLGASNLGIQFQRVTSESDLLKILIELIDSWQKSSSSAQTRRLRSIDKTIAEVLLE